MTLPSGSFSLSQVWSEINVQFYPPPGGSSVHNLTNTPVRYLASSGWGSANVPIKSLPISTADLRGKTAYMWVQATVIYDSSSAVLTFGRSNVIWATSGSQFIDSGVYVYGLYNQFSTFNYSSLILNNSYNYKSSIRVFMYDSNWATLYNGMTFNYSASQSSGGIAEFNGPTGVNFFTSGDQNQVRNFVILI